MRVNKNIQLVVGASAILSASICMSSPGFAEEQSVGLWDKFTNNVSTTWDSDKYELYIPFFTWHNRLMYDKEKTDTYNEEPWGFGIGKYRYDEDNDWHALYAMAFMDSHNKVEPIVGYGFQKMWIPGDLDGFRMGAGFTLGITAREEYSYIPLPAPLPLVSIEYDKLSVQATYIPGTYNNGNVLFAWLRWQW
ncbi:TPA: lipid IV(A) palmitoyltransferase PagP [Providencia alcalifaciens]